MNLRVVHAFWRSQLYVHPEPSHAQLKDWLKFPMKTLPLVWTHATGRRSLILGVTAQQVEGMSVLESEELLVRTLEKLRQDELVAVPQDEASVSFAPRMDRRNSNA